MDNRKEQLNSSKYELFILISEISAALWVHIAIFEVTLRNLIHSLLTKICGSEFWWRTPNLLSKRDHLDIMRLEQKMSSNKALVSSYKVVERISFSFWVELCSTRYYEKIWKKLEAEIPSLLERRKDFYNKAREIRNLRNVIAHHGPILRRDLFRDHAYLHELTALLDPELANEVKRKSRVLDLLLNARLVGSGGGI